MPTEPSISKDKEFSRIRAILWPIHGYELKKLLPMLIMFACIAFSYSALRASKDSGVMENAAGQLSAGAIPLLKVILVLPCAMLTKNLYNYLRYRFSDKTTFYTLISGFLLFFPTFAFILHPSFEAYRNNLKETREKTMLVSKADVLTSQEISESSETFEKISEPAKIVESKGKLSYLTSIGTGLRNLFNTLLFALTVNLDNTLFYVMAELWGSVALSLLFWGLANSVCKISETSRFYPLLGFGANAATGLVSVIHPLIQGFFRKFTTLNPKDAQALYHVFYCKSLSIIVLILGLITLGCYHYLQTEVLTDPRLYTPVKSTKKKEKSQGLVAGLRYITSDPYLRNICFSVVAYGVLSQMIEIIYKEQLNLYFTQVNAVAGKVGIQLKNTVKDDVNQFNTMVTSASGIIAAFMGLFGAGNIIRYMGWTFSAMVTPIIMLITGSLSLGSVVFSGYLCSLTNNTINPYLIGVWLGAIQLMFSKGIKYTLFDSTKEMTYIPLDAETKNRAKAEIDVVGSRFGKAGGSLLNTGLIAAAGGSTLSIAPISLAMLLAFGARWCLGTISLGKQFEARIATPSKDDESSLKRF